MGLLRYAGMDPIEFANTGGEGYAPGAMPPTATGYIVSSAPPEVETDLGPCIFVTPKGTKVEGRLVKAGAARVVFHGRIGDKVFDGRPFTPPSVSVYPSCVEIDFPRVRLPADLADTVRAALGTPGA